MPDGTPGLGRMDLSGHPPCGKRSFGGVRAHGSEACSAAGVAVSRGAESTRVRGIELKAFLPSMDKMAQPLRRLLAGTCDSFADGHTDSKVSPANVSPQGTPAACSGWRDRGQAKRGREG